MSVIEITNPTKQHIETDLVRNGLWAGWSYLLGVDIQANAEELERIKTLGAVVTE
jgi:hypothetical protein